MGNQFPQSAVLTRPPPSLKKLQKALCRTKSKEWVFCLANKSHLCLLPSFGRKNTSTQEFGKFLKVLILFQHIQQNWQDFWPCEPESEWATSTHHPPHSTHNSAGYTGHQYTLVVESFMGAPDSISATSATLPKHSESSTKEHFENRGEKKHPSTHHSNTTLNFVWKVLFQSLSTCRHIFTAL